MEYFVLIWQTLCGKTSDQTNLSRLGNSRQISLHARHLYTVPEKEDKASRLLDDGLEQEASERQHLRFTHLESSSATDCPTCSRVCLLRALRSGQERKHLDRSLSITPCLDGCLRCPQSGKQSCRAFGAVQVQRDCGRGQEVCRGDQETGRIPVGQITLHGYGNSRSRVV